MAHYPATEGLTSTQILALVREHRAAFAEVVEPLPAAVLARERLPDRVAALAEAHFGESAGRHRGRRVDGLLSTNCCSRNWRSGAGGCAGTL